MSSASLAGTAKELFGFVLNNNVAQVDDILRYGDSLSWRALLRLEFEIANLVVEFPVYFNDSMVATKLISCEITTLSSFHVAGLLGRDDILCSMLDKDIPIDMSLQAGTTVLHLAAFGGKLDTVKLLINVYKADVNKQDRYGWSPLHYACTEGHRKIAECLLEAGTDIYLRDQDRTTAAFRAQVNGHDDLVTYLCRMGEEDELLNVAEEGDDEHRKKEPDYSTPQKFKKAATHSISETPAEYRTASLKDLRLASDGSRDPDYGTLVARASFKADPGHPDVMRPATRAKSLIETDPVYDTRLLNTYAPTKSLGTPAAARAQKSLSMPVRSKRVTAGTIRRLIRRELQAAFGDDGYMTPEQLRDSILGTLGEDDDGKVGPDGIGVQTLKGLMRDEFSKYKADIDSEFSTYDRADPVGASGPYEDVDPYASIAALPEPPPLPSGVPPPLPPPRTPTSTISHKELSREIEVDDDREGGPVFTRSMVLQPSQPTSAALAASFQKLAPKLGENWRKLAYALPMERAQGKVADRIKAIEAKYPDSMEKQAASALAEWRINMGSGANTDALIIGLRKAGLYDIIADVERATQEFTA